MPSVSSQFLGKISSVNQTGEKNVDTSNVYTIPGGKILEILLHTWAMIQLRFSLTNKLLNSHLHKS